MNDSGAEVLPPQPQLSILSELHKLSGVKFKVALDEAQFIKNCETSAHKGCRDIPRQYTVMLSGSLLDIEIWMFQGDRLRQCCDSGYSGRDDAMVTADAVRCRDILTALLLLSRHYHSRATAPPSPSPSDCPSAAILASAWPSSSLILSRRD